jgi:NADPH:quinone reductase-like Zn-dependent oxidoreductase
MPLVEEPVFPARIGCEATGIIEEVTSDLTEFRPGQRAAVIPAFSINRYGTYGDSVVLPAFAMAHTPGNLNLHRVRRRVDAVRHRLHAGGIWQT